MKRVKERYQNALGEFVSQVKEDRYVIAAIVVGSYAQDTLWEKSDIDLVLIVDDTKNPIHFESFTQDDIQLNTWIYTRQQFKRAYEAVPGSNNFLSFLSNAKCLFCKDSTLENYVNEMNVLEEEFKSGLLLSQGALAVAHYIKSQKYLIAQEDVYSCFVEMLRLADILARIEILLHDQIPQKDVMKDALQWNSELFHQLSVCLMNEPKTEEFLSDVLKSSLQYIKLHEKQLFQPIFEILSEISATVSLSYIYEQILGVCYIEKDLFVEAMEWLVKEGFIEKYATSVRVTAKSKTMVYEAAYSYEGGVI